MAKGQPATELLSLPNEIILLILAYTCGEKLCPDLDLVCKSIRELMVSVYRQSYGKGPTPVPITASGWKEIALHNEKYRDYPEHQAKHDIWKFQNCIFLLLSAEVADDEAGARELIYWLHADPHRHPEGLATIVGALCTLNRKNEAEMLLKQYCKDGIPHEWKFLLCARFELDFSIDWAEVPQECLGKCRQAAALRGDLDLVLKLRQNSLNAGISITGLDDESAAIRGDRVELLRYLLDTHTDKLNEDSWNELVRDAAVFKKANALQLLLQRVESQVNLAKAYEYALCHMDSKILKMIKQHSPHLVGAYLPHGKLQIVHILNSFEGTPETHHRAIEALMEHDSVDINAIGKDGRAAVHSAWRDHTGILEFLEKLGADVENPGHIQQTPKELISCDDYLLALDRFSPELSEKKLKLAKQWLTEYMPAVFTGRIGRDFNNDPHVLESQVNKLALLWSQRVGLQTMQELCSLLEKPEYRSIEKLGWIIRTYCYLNKISHMNEADQRTNFDIRDIQNRFGKDYATAFADNLNLWAVADNAEPISVPVDIKDIIDNFGMDLGGISWDGVDSTAVAQYAARILDPVDISHLRDFVNSETSRAFYLTRDMICHLIESESSAELEHAGN